MTRPKEGAESHTQIKTTEIKFFWQQLNISWGLDKFRNKEENWRGQIERVEEVKLKVVVCHNVQEDILKVAVCDSV